MKEMTYEEARKLLGLKKGFTKAELKKAYIKQIRRFHPDMKFRSNETSEEKTIQIAQANKILEEGPGSKKTIPSFKKEYRAIKAKIGKGTITPGELQDAYQSLIKQSITSEELEKLDLAREAINQEINNREYISKLQKKSFVRRVRKTAMTPEEKIVRIQQELMLAEGKEELKTNAQRIINNLKKRAKMIKKKLHIPIIKKEQGRKIVKYAVLTIGLASAIIGGKLIWDNKKRAYTPKLLTYRRDKQ